MAAAAAPYSTRAKIIITHVDMCVCVAWRGANRVHTSKFKNMYMHKKKRTRFYN